MFSMYVGRGYFNIIGTSINCLMDNNKKNSKLESFLLFSFHLFN